MEKDSELLRFYNLEAIKQFGEAQNPASQISDMITNFEETGGWSDESMDRNITLDNFAYNVLARIGYEISNDIDLDETVKKFFINNADYKISKPYQTAEDGDDGVQPRLISIEPLIAKEDGLVLLPTIYLIGITDPRQKQMTLENFALGYFAPGYGSSEQIFVMNYERNDNDDIKLDAALLDKSDQQLVVNEFKTAFQNLTQTNPVVETISEEELESTIVEELELSVRSYNILKRMGVGTLSDLVTTSELEIFASFPGLKDRNLDEIKGVLAEKGLSLQEDYPEEVSVNSQKVEFTSRPIEELGLNKRSYNALKMTDVDTIGELVSFSERQIAGVPRIGKLSLANIHKSLAKKGLSLKGESVKK